MSEVKLPSRPRWGIFSSAVFSDPGKLAADVLLYDRLVLPVPTDDDWARWHQKGWRPDDIAGYLKALGTMAVDVEWSTPLRGQFDFALERLAELGKKSEPAAYGLTPMVIAMHGWKEIDKESPVPPIPVVAFRSRDEAQAVFAYVPSGDQRPARVRGGSPEVVEAAGDLAADEERGRAVLERETAALFHRCVAMPEAVEGPYWAREALDRAIALSKTEDYQEARRAMYEWEDAVVEQGWPVEHAVRELERRMNNHDRLVEAEFKNAIRRVIFRVVSMGGGAAAGALVAGPLGALLGAIAGEAAKKMGEKFGEALAEKGVDRLVEIGDAAFPRYDSSTDPGKALRTAISAIYR